MLLRVSEKVSEGTQTTLGTTTACGGAYANRNADCVWQVARRHARSRRKAFDCCCEASCCCCSFRPPSQPSIFSVIAEPSTTAQQGRYRIQPDG